MLCALASWAGRAHADEAVAKSTSGSASGYGLKLGEAAVLHLGMGVEVGWDSNIAYSSSDDPNNRPVNSFYLRLMPEFEITNSLRDGGARQFLFDVHGALNYIEYLNTNHQIEAERQFNVDAGAKVTLFATSPYNATVFDNFARTAQPPYHLVGYTINRDTNDLGLRLSLSPGGGRLSIYFSYIFGVDWFERISGVQSTDQFDAFNLLSHRFDLRVSWRFLPKTAVYVDASEGLYLYQSEDTYHPNSYPLRVEAGIQGLITTKLTVNAWVGYGNGFYDHPHAQTNMGVTATAPYANPNSVVGGASLTWQPTILSTGTLGYSHDFENSLLGAYYDMDRVYLNWQQLIWRFTANLNFSYSNDRYKGINEAVQASTTTARTDNYFTLFARVDYPLKRYLFLSLGYNLFADVTDGKLNESLQNGAVGIVPVNYNRSVVYLQLVFRY